MSRSRSPVPPSFGPRSTPCVSGRAKSAILDALLRLDAEVPVALLVERLDEDCLVETYLLLARGRETNTAVFSRLFAAAPRESGARWAAACALTERRDPGIRPGLFPELDPALCRQLDAAGVTTVADLAAEGKV